MIMSPIRWVWIIIDPSNLALIYLLYMLLIMVVNRAKFTPLMLLYPLYGMMVAYLVVPFAIPSYIQMSMKHKNWGYIKNEVRDPQLMREIDASVSA